MKYALLTKEQLESLRPSLDTIATVQARRASTVGRKIPDEKRPTQSYVKDARGWTIPYALYPQITGRVVVVMEDEAHAMLNKASQSLFTIDRLPDGFQEGNA